jgi:hypothetical protein
MHSPLFVNRLYGHRLRKKALTPEEAAEAQKKLDERCKIKKESKKRAEVTMLVLYCNFQKIFPAFY